MVAELISYFTSFWGKVSIVAGGLFGIATIAMVVNAVINHYRNKALKKIFEIEEKNYIVLTQIKELMEDSYGKKKMDKQ